MLTTVAVSMASTFLLAFGLFGVWALFVSRKRDTPELNNKQPTGYLQELAAKIGALESQVAALPSLWEEERERATKFANRAYASEKRTRELLAGDEDSDIDEDEDQRLLELDGIRSETNGVQPMSSSLEGPVDADLRARAAEVLARGF